MEIRFWNMKKLTLPEDGTPVPKHVEADTPWK